ncbi:MAG: class I SAM-dependent methyltransferase [Candidatus Scalindua sp.]
MSYEGGGYELVESRIQADLSAKIRRLCSFLPDTKVRILDVGCGKGFFVKACLDTGIQTMGIDLSDTAVAFAKNTLGVDAKCGRIEDLVGNIGLYDAVTFWTTIEHVRNPLRTLSSIRKVLKPGGLLFLDTGIGHDWLDRLLPGFVQWYDPPQHLFVFSLDSISILLPKAGFQFENIDPCFER